MANSIIKNRYLIEYLSVVAVSLIYFVMGLLIGPLSPLLNIIEKDGYHDIPPVSRTVSSWTINATNIGIAIGSLIASYLSGHIGRKCTMLVTTIPIQILAQLFMYFANNVYMIYVSCALRGFYVAVSYGIVPTYVSEITSAKLRGPSTVFGMLLLPIGGLISGIVQSVTSISMTSITMGIVGLCTVPLLFLIPESPYYYVSKHRPDECKKALRQLRRTKNIETEFVEIQMTWNEIEKSQNVSWTELFTNKLNLRVFLICFGVQTVQQFSGFAPLYGYVTVIIIDTGINLSLLTVTMLVCGVGIGSTTVSIFTIELFGRRILYFIVCVMALLAVGTIGTCFYLEHYYTSAAFGILETCGMLLFLACLAYGMIFIPNVLSAELFPSDIKATGIAVLMTLQAGQGVIVTIMYDQLSSIVDYLPFVVFFCVTVIGLIFGYFFIPETKNKTLTEIQKELNLKS